MDKSAVIEALEEIAFLLELSDSGPFEVLAFRNGARSLDDWEGDLHAAVRDGRLTDIYGVGKGIASVVSELVTTGGSARHDELRTGFPDGILELRFVPGLGVKKIRALHRELGIGSLDALEAAAREGRIRELAGFGAKSEERMMSGVERARRRLSRS